MLKYLPLLAKSFKQIVSEIVFGELLNPVKRFLIKAALFIPWALLAILFLCIAVTTGVLSMNLFTGVFGLHTLLALIPSLILSLGVGVTLFLVFMNFVILCEEEETNKKKVWNTLSGDN